MKEFYKNNKKKIITGLSLLLILAGGYWSVKYHLSKTVEIILQIAFPVSFILFLIICLSLQMRTFICNSHNTYSLHTPYLLLIIEQGEGRYQVSLSLVVHT